MSKLFNGFIVLVSTLFVCVISLTSCGNSDNANIRYVAAKLIDSEM